MYCPNCGQERVSMETSFCSRCGYLLTGTAELMQLGGIMPQPPQKAGWRGSSPRNRGIKQGVFIFLLSFLIVPLMAMLTLIMNIEPFPVAISAILLVAGGLLRVIYALMFESPVQEDTVQFAAGSAAAFKPGPWQQALPPQMSQPASAYTAPAGRWRDTNDLEPRTVTEGTTKLLEKDELPPQ